MPPEGGTDADGALELRPTIEELVRTRYCPVEIFLLVDRVAAVKAPHVSKHAQAFRLWLSDGCKSVQGMPKAPCL
jgi:hypothetical protein